MQQELIEMLEKVVDHVVFCNGHDQRFSSTTYGVDLLKEAGALIEKAKKNAPAIPQGEPKTVCWFKHGPYEDGELLTCVFEDPQDEDNYSALIFKDESIRDYTAPAPSQDVRKLTLERDLLRDKCQELEAQLMFKETAQEVTLTEHISLLEEVASSLEDYKHNAPWGVWDRMRLEKLNNLIAALRAKENKS